MSPSSFSFLLTLDLTLACGSVWHLQSSPQEGMESAGADSLAPNVIPGLHIFPLRVRIAVKISQEFPGNWGAECSCWTQKPWLTIFWCQVSAPETRTQSWHITSPRNEESFFVLHQFFVPFDEASTNWSRINLLVSYCSRALAAPRFRPSWGMLGYVYTKEDLSTIAPILWWQLLCFVQKICQQLLPSSGSSCFSSLLRCCWLKRSVSKLLLSSAICSLCFISKITTSFTFAFTCIYFHITFASFSRHLFLPFQVFPTLDSFQNCWTIYFIW